MHLYRSRSGNILVQDNRSYLIEKDWDEILASGRRCLGFFVKDHLPNGRGRNVLILPELAGLSRYGFTHLPALPGTKIEADSVSQILQKKGWNVTEHLQADATEEALKKIHSPEVLHIATHGFFLADVSLKTETYNGMRADLLQQNPLLRSGLMLAGAASIARDSINYMDSDDGILTAAEAANLQLDKTGLVVLSACETGLGEQHNGQGVYGLQRAFLTAGAETVIMSLWVVDDFATQELMTSFYREWSSGKNKAEAFRLAQLQIRKKYPSPYYWAAFVMIGS